MRQQDIKIASTSPVLHCRSSLVARSLAVRTQTLSHVSNTFYCPWRQQGTTTFARRPFSLELCTTSFPQVASVHKCALALKPRKGHLKSCTVKQRPLTDT